MNKEILQAILAGKFSGIPSGTFLHGIKVGTSEVPTKTEITFTGVEAIDTPKGLQAYTQDKRILRMSIKGQKATYTPLDIPGIQLAAIVASKGETAVVMDYYKTEKGSFRLRVANPENVEATYAELQPASQEMGQSVNAL